MTTIDLAEKYDLKVPRYTSYPTAPHFAPSLQHAQYAVWLERLPADRPLSMYLHIPFCDQMCWFCGCYTKIVNRYEPIASYLQALHVEIDLLADRLHGRFGVRHLHFGGGSPTMLAPSDWQVLLDHLRHRFDLDVAAEIAVELDPRETTEPYIVALAQAGVTRVSIGVQDFDPVVQQAINRIQPFQVVERVVHWLRHHGIRAINLDLMFGLPLQSEAKVRAMVDRALGLTPSRVALFGYAHVPWMKVHQRLIHEADLPDANARLHQLKAARDVLVAAGYCPVGLDHFAQPSDALSKALDDGRLRRNFQGYTTDDAETLIGLGASAIGRLPWGYVQNLSPLAEYRRALNAGRLPTARGLTLTPEDRLRRDVIEGLMCTFEVNLGEISAKHGHDVGVFAAERAALAPLAADGLVALQGDSVRVTTVGRPFVRVVAAVFDSYLQASEGRHSRAV